MRTTLTLEDDVAARLKEAMRATGQSLKETVNSMLRLGLEAAAQPRPEKRFVIQARDLGSGRTNLDFDDIGELLERFEGPGHR